MTGSQYLVIDSDTNKRWASAPAFYLEIAINDFYKPFACYMPVL